MRGLGHSIPRSGALVSAYRWCLAARYADRRGRRRVSNHHHAMSSAQTRTPICERTTGGFFSQSPNPVRCARRFPTWRSDSRAVIWAAGADGTCTRSVWAVASAGGSAVIGRATVGVSDRTGSSGGVECSRTDSADKPRASPPGSASQPPHRAIETIRPRIWRSRDAGFGPDGGGALPCHNHSPDSWLSLPIALHPESRGHPSAELGCGRSHRNDSRSAQ